jgi:hypothetical protein
VPKGSAVEDVERKLKREYPNNPHAVFGTLNKIGLMKGNKPTAKGLKKAHADKRMKKMGRIAKKAQSRYG